MSSTGSSGKFPLNVPGAAVGELYSPVLRYHNIMIDFLFLRFDMSLGKRSTDQSIYDILSRTRILSQKKKKLSIKYRQISYSKYQKCIKRLGLFYLLLLRTRTLFFNVDVFFPKSQQNSKIIKNIIYSLTFTRLGCSTCKYDLFELGSLYDSYLKNSSASFFRTWRT